MATLTPEHKKELYTSAPLPYVCAETLAHIAAAETPEEVAALLPQYFARAISVYAPGIQDLLRHIYASTMDGTHTQQSTPPSYALARFTMGIGFITSPDGTEEFAVNYDIEIAVGANAHPLFAQIFLIHELAGHAGQKFTRLNQLLSASDGDLESAIKQWNLEYDSVEASKLEELLIAYLEKPLYDLIDRRFLLHYLPAIQSQNPELAEDLQAMAENRPAYGYLEYLRLAHRNGKVKPTHEDWELLLPRLADRLPHLDSEGRADYSALGR